MAAPEHLHPEHHRLVRKLESIADLSPEEKQALLTLPLTVQRLAPGQNIVREGDTRSEAALILDGFACRYRSLPDGRRQIMSFHTPGDITDLQSLSLPIMDHSVGTLVPTTLGVIPHQNLLDLAQRYSGIAAAFWRDTLIDGAIFRAWIVNIGRCPARQRIAHLLCEMTLRFKAVGLASNHGYRLPLTQGDIADALGLSPVQVNRVPHDLKTLGLITSQDSTVAALDWEGLKQAGEFDPAYLHLEREDAA